MLIREKAGNINSIAPGGRPIDWLPLEWYESNKRILRKKTLSGKEIALKFLKENPALTQGDILYEDDQMLIAIDILPCEVIVVTPRSMYEMASVCYEIGNKHLPLFYEDAALLVPYEAPLFHLLNAAGFSPARETRKLLHPLKTTVAAHGHSGSPGLFSKILQLTTPSADV